MAYSFLSHAPPVLMNPSRVVPFSESDRFESQPNVALAPLAQSIQKALTHVRKPPSLFRQFFFIDSSLDSGEKGSERVPRQGAEAGGRAATLVDHGTWPHVQPRDRVVHGHGHRGQQLGQRRRGRHARDAEQFGALRRRGARRRSTAGRGRPPTPRRQPDRLEGGAKDAGRRNAAAEGETRRARVQTE